MAGAADTKTDPKVDEGWLHGHDYEHVFDANAFLREYWGDEDDMWRHLLTSWHTYLNDGRCAGHRYLDLGCGPSLTGVIPVPERFTDITMADLSPSNLDTIRRWLDGGDVSFNWQPIMTLHAELDNCQNVTEWTREKISHLKKSVKELMVCDVTSKHPLGVTDAKFDVIASSFCLECAAKTIEEYRECIFNTSSLLAPGGHLLLRGDLNCEKYVVGGQTFHYLSISIDDVKEALKNNFELLDFKYKEHPYEAFVLLARKK